MQKQRLTTAKSIIVLVLGFLWVIPMVFYFVLLPPIAIDPTYVMEPQVFLPWMAESGTIRRLLWGFNSIIILLNMTFVPTLIKEYLGDRFPAFSNIASIVGILGLFTLLMASLILVAEEMPLARLYLAASPQEKVNIEHIYLWQMNFTNILFDFLGFILIGFWIFISTVIIFLSKHGSKLLIGVGVIASLSAFAFSFGWFFQIGWLGDRGIGLSSFVIMPLWIALCGFTMLRAKS